jgi:two-component system, NtrC family, nitrogen regulation response regulator GlnG
MSGGTGLHSYPDRLRARPHWPPGRGGSEQREPLVACDPPTRCRRCQTNPRGATLHGVSGLPSTLEDDTRQPLPRSERGAPVRVPTLTIVSHPDPSRIGARATPAGLLMGQRVSVSRIAPEFRHTSAGAAAPLADSFISRKSVSLSSGGGKLHIDASGSASSVSVDGQPLNAVLEIPAERLERGVLLDLAQRVLLLLQLTLPGDDRVDQHGLIGGSDAMRRLYLQMDRAAAHQRPVLVLGESGSGKELVARAIHGRSARAGGPYVAVNMAALPASTAAAELFGHVRGAFTGAQQASPGLFRRAQGGTLLLDEIGESPLELQAMLLRAIETSEVLPLGSATPHGVDVRIIAATDADVQLQSEQGQFKLPLLHRLAGDEISVPPLRSRRDDIARLWVHFVREELGGSAWLSTPEADPPWVSTTLMARLLNCDWPGNVRELRNWAGRFVRESLQRQDHRAPPEFEARLAPPAAPSAAPRQPVRSSTADVADADALEVRSRPADIDTAQLLAALQAHAWQTGATARALQISRTTLYRLIDQCPAVRKAKDIERAEILAARARHRADVSEMAAELRVSERGLLLRMRDLGIE